MFPGAQWEQHYFVRISIFEKFYFAVNMGPHRNKGNDWKVKVMEQLKNTDESCEAPCDDKYVIRRLTCCSPWYSCNELKAHEQKSRCAYNSFLFAYTDGGDWLL